MPGTCATVTVQGRRALPVEVQSLIAPAGGEISRRTVSGLDSARTAMVLAVLQRWGGVALAGQDVLAMSTSAQTQFRARQIGFVFQMFHLLPYLTVLENVAVAALEGSLTTG